jgi:hypothetical protein
VTSKEQNNQDQENVNAEQDDGMKKIKIRKTSKVLRETLSLKPVQTKI